MKFDGSDIYPVGLFLDVQQAWSFREPDRLLAGLRYIRNRAARREWRAIRNYFNGYLAEHGCPHNAGKGWTKKAAKRRVERICRRMEADQ